MTLQRALRRVMSHVQTLCGLCIAGMGVAVVYEIAARSLFDEPTIWAQEASVYLLIALAFLGLAPTHAADEHIRIDLLTRRLGPRVQLLLRAATLVAIATYSAVAAYGGIEMVRQSLRFGRRSLTLLSVPVWIPQLLIPLGMGLLALVALGGLWTMFAPGAGGERDD